MEEPKGKKSKLKVLNLIYTVIPSTILMPLGIGTLAFFRPYKIPFLGSLILPVRSHCTNFILLARFLIAIYEFTLLFCVTIIGVFYAFYVILPTILFIFEEAIQLFEKHVFSQEYRKLQVLAALINLCLRNRILPLAAFTAPATQILASFLLITL